MTFNGFADLRHRIHAQPELAYEEFATGDLVAERLQAWGYTVHRGLGQTGVVGQLKVGNGTRKLGLRADMLNIAGRLVKNNVAELTQ